MPNKIIIFISLILLLGDSNMSSPVCTNTNFQVVSHVSKIMNTSALLNANIAYDKKINCSIIYAFSWGNTLIMSHWSGNYIYRFTPRISYQINNLTCDTDYYYQPTMFGIPDLGCGFICQGDIRTFHTHECL